MKDKLDKIFQQPILESRVPKLGIWWLIDGKVVSFQEEYRNVPSVHNSRDSDLLHFNEFDKLKLSGDYTDYERGRVIYRDNPGIFIIYCSEDTAKDKEALSRIARDFSLPLSKVKIATDPHYKRGDTPDFEYE